MNKNEAENVIKDTIEYANEEIKKSKKKAKRGIFITACSFLLVIVASCLFWGMEMPVKYTESIVSVSVPEDKGLDITVNLGNYKSAKCVLVKQRDDTYDLYIGITQTLYTKMVKSDEHLIRAGNGLIIDFNSNKVLESMPEENDFSEKIMHVYYIDNLTDKIMSMDNSELINYAEKTLVWTR